MATSDQNPYRPPHEGTPRELLEVFVTWKRCFFLGLAMICAGISATLVGAISVDTSQNIPGMIMLTGVLVLIVGIVITVLAGLGWLLTL